MSTVKSLSVGNGDMFYIRHNTDNFTIIDCCLTDENRDKIIKELKYESSDKTIVRFISTHPDEDHIHGIEYLDSKMPISNFYCVRNAAMKPLETASFKHYCKLRDGDKAYYVYQNCERRWMNKSDDERGHAGIHIPWPRRSNINFQYALEEAACGVAFNNISLIARYFAANNTKMMWLGDLETEFMEYIEDDISLTPVHIIFAPHHGRSSGKIPDSWLDKLKPKIIVIGESPSRHLHYYTGYHTLTQNSAGDLTFDCDDYNKIHIYASSETYSVDYLDDEGQNMYQFYIGTLNI